MRRLFGTGAGNEPSMTSTSHQPIRYDVAEARFWRRRRLLYRGFVAVVALIVLSTLVELGTGLPLYGVDTRSVSASAGGTDLAVTYPRVTRGQLDTTVRIEVRRVAGFDRPVTLDITSEYLDLFTDRDIAPKPITETTDGDSLSMTFVAPRDDTLQISFDLAARPRTTFGSASGTVAVVDDDHAHLVAVYVQTDVRP